MYKQDSTIHTCIAYKLIKLENRQKTNTICVNTPYKNMYSVFKIDTKSYILQICLIYREVMAELASYFLSS